MEWYPKIKRFFEGGYWTKEQVATAVEKGKITQSEYEEITGENYEA